MIELWLMMFVALVLIWTYNHCYYRKTASDIEKKKVEGIFLILVVVLGGFLGLRTSYNDTFAYRHLYELIRPFPEFWDTYSFSLSSDPGFMLCNGILKTLGVSTQSWLMIYALITIGLYVHFIKKQGTDLSVNIFLFFCVGAYMFVGAAIKQSLAAAICLCGIQFALDKKWIRYCLVVIVAMTFHAYAAIFFLVPFLMFKPWTSKTLFMIFATIGIAMSLQTLFGAIVDITASIGEGYTVEDFAQGGINVFRVIVCNASTLLALLYHKTLFEGTTRKENLFFNMSMVNGCIMFVGMFGTANYFGRLANFFVLAQVITLPWMINKFPQKIRMLIRGAMYVGYLLYFYYEYNVVYGKFSDVFSRITVSEFIQQLVK